MARVYVGRTLYVGWRSLFRRDRSTKITQISTPDIEGVAQVRGNRKVTCSQCSKDFSYMYEGGRPRKICPDCKPWKKGASQSCNAYEKSKPFPWGYLPSGWWVSRGGCACRTIGPYWITVWERGGHFGFNIPSLRNERPRISDIEATTVNVEEALNWAERMSENLFRSFLPR